jgi:soluble lytic murein transglycosylase
LFIVKRKLPKIIILVLLLFIAFSLQQFKILEKIRYPYPYKPLIEKYASEYSLDPLFVLAVMREESRFKPESCSPKGALGLMQIMPATAREIAHHLGEEYREDILLDPEVNIRYGTWYLAQLNKQFDGNAVIVLAAYNAGCGRVAKWLQASDLGPYLIEDIPFFETREYVKKVLKSYKIYSRLYDEQVYYKE